MSIVFSGGRAIRLALSGRGAAPAEVVFLSRWQMLALAPLGADDGYPLVEIAAEPSDRHGPAQDRAAA